MMTLKNGSFPPTVPWHKLECGSVAMNMPIFFEFVSLVLVV